jgi:hypothetical protein
MSDDPSLSCPDRSGNVIVMNRHRTNARFAHLPTVEAYWQALRGSRLVPGRADLDPRGIESALEHAFLLEHVAPGVGRLRIAGGHLGDLLGMEVRGMPLSAFVTPEARLDLALAVQQVCARPALARLSLQAESGIGKPVLEARLLLLPLTGEDGLVNRVLGCLDSCGSIGRAPRRFAVTDCHLSPLTRDRGWPAAQPPQPPQPQPHMASPASAVQPARPAVPQTQAGTGYAAKAGPSGRHLRLVTPEP